MEKAQITDLVKGAMGFNKERGDTLSVANSPFTGAEREDCRSACGSSLKSSISPCRAESSS